MKFGGYEAVPLKDHATNNVVLTIPDWALWLGVAVILGMILMVVRHFLRSSQRSGKPA